MQLNRKSKTLFYGISKWSIYKTLIINRPLLNKRKHDLQTYCDNHSVPYGIDETNFLDIYQRNVIRKQISKWTNKQFDTKYQSVLNKNKVLHSQYISVQKAYLLWEQSNWSLNFFNKLNKKLQYHLTYNILSNLQLANINHNKIVLAVTFINKGKPKSELRLGNNYFFTKDNANLYIINNNK
jgi:tRNA(Ile)-lysidine synthase